MSYTIRWEPYASKELEKLPKEIAARIVQKVDKIIDDPFHYLEHYAGHDTYKLRVGHYRLLVDVDFTNKILKIQVLDHRKRIYKHHPNI